jgi:1-acyl-sn-glycerol-3-phosphate acyltransferase
MGLTRFLYRCPSCGADPLQGVGDEATCSECGHSFRRGRAHSTVEVTTPEGQTRSVVASELAEAIAAFGGPMSRALQEDGRIRYAAKARARRSGREDPVYHAGALLGFSEQRGEAVDGELTALDEAVRFTPDDGAPREWTYLEISSLQASSSSVQIASDDGSVVQFKFPEDSSRRWEDLLRGLISRAWEGAGRGRVVEFQPRVLVRPHSAGHTVETSVPSGPVPDLSSVPTRTEGEGWYPLFKNICWGLTRSLARISVEGVENVPSTGPFILVFNHQSILDPLIAQSHCPRTVHSMTKSTQFAHPLFRWLVPRVAGFPVRRYRVDPQAVRTTLRFLDEGRAVGIYPEGERSWDGALQPLRRGTIKLLLKSGVPIVPCGIQGSFDVWPRWAGRPRRASVAVRFGEPILLGRFDDREARNRAVPWATAIVSEALKRLSGEGTGGDDEAAGSGTVHPEDPISGHPGEPSP